MPSQSQIQTMIGDLIALLENLDRYGRQSAEGFSADELQIHQNLNLAAAQTAGDRFQFAEDILAGVKSFRNGLDSIVRFGRRLVTPAILEYGRSLGFPENDVETVLLRIKRYFEDHIIDVPSRRITFGSVSDLGGGAGSGTVVRKVIDINGDNIEAHHAEKIVLECIQDEHSGAVKHEEIFEIRGEPSGEDALDLKGSGRLARIKALSARDSQTYIQNPSFSDDTAVDPITSISGWTISSGTYAVVASNVYRGFDGDTTPRSLRFDGNGVITQALSLRRAQFNPNVPILMQVAFRSGTATAGTVTLRLGGVSAAGSITTATQDWTRATTTAYFNDFNAQNLTLSVEITGSNGTITVDDIVIAEMVNFDGVWYAIVGGVTPFLNRKRFRFTDTEPAKTPTGPTSQGLINHWLWRLFGITVVPTTGTPAWFDPIGNWTN